MRSIGAGFILILSLYCLILIPPACAAGSKSEVTVLRWLDDPKSPSSGKRSTNVHLLMPKPHDDSEKFALLLLLHGSGQNGADMIELWEDAAQKKRLIVLAPGIEGIPFKNERGNLWPFINMVNEVSRNYPVAPGKIYVAGVSSGNVFIPWLMLMKPGLFEAAAMISSEPFSNWQSELDVCKLSPIFFVHGKKDEQFSYKLLRNRVKILQKRGVFAEWLTDDEAGHGVLPEWPALISEWFLKEKPAPMACFAEEIKKSHS